MHMRVKSCAGKHIEECENIKINGECNLPEVFGVCSNQDCLYTNKLDWYKEQRENDKNEIAKLKSLNTQFRTLMLMPSQAERLLQKNEIDFSGIKGLISRQRKTWDTCDENTGLYMMEYHSLFAQEYSIWLHEKNSKIQIDEVVKEAKKNENSKAAKKVYSEIINGEREEKKKVEKEAKEQKAKTPFGRAVQSYIKLGMTEEIAKKLCISMGMKE